MQQTRAFRDWAGWLLLLAIVYAPWAYGCTRPWAIIGLDILMGGIGLAWGLGWALERRPLHWPAGMLVGAGWLFIQGWLLAWNGHFLYDAQSGMFAPNPAGIAFLPGSIDPATTSRIIWRYSGLLITLLVAADLTLEVKWRRRLMQTVALTGLSIILLGYAQKLGGAHTIFWQDERPSKSFFATYFYHGNAGAYINLVLPFLIGQAFLTVRNEDSRWKTTGWILSVALVVIAAFVNISKAAMTISILLLILVAAGRQFLGGTSLLSFFRRHQILPIVCGFMLIFPVAIFISSGTLRWRWLQFFREVGPDYPRLLLAQSSLRMIPEAGAFGFGPGSFQLAFPHYTLDMGDKIPGVWTFAHQDYLQTIIEWGWVGALVWGFLFFGGLFRGIHQLCTRHAEVSTNDQTTLFCAVLALIGISLHALGDFPLQIASLQFYVAVFVGLCWNSPQWLRLKMKTKRRETAFLRQ